MQIARLIILFIFIFVGLGIVRSVISLSSKKNAVEERKAVQMALEAKHVELENRLIEATSAAFIEKIARDKLGLVREGETVVILGRTREQDGSDQQKQQNSSSWKKWLGLFFE